jgi:type IV secretion system protein TrbL
VAQGGAGVGDALASGLLTVVKIGIFHWLMTNYAQLATAAFDTFLTWGVSVGGDFSRATFTSPSAIVNRGFRSAVLLKDHIDRLSGGLGALAHGFQILCYWVDYYLIIIAFWLVGLHLVMTIIEYHLAVLVGAVLIPWGLFRPLAFFGESALGVGSRPAATRVCSRNAVTTLPQVPSSRHWAK